MTLKSLITIDVDDSAFTAFQAKFREFQNTAKMSLGIAPSGGGEEFDRGVINEGGMADAVLVLNEIKDLIKKLVSQEKEGGFGGSSSGGGIGGGISGITSIFNGGAGKLFMTAAATAAAAVFATYEAGKFVLNGAGMGGLATDATALRGASRGANTTIGAYRAFQTDLGPYADGEQLLHAVANAQSDITNPLNITLRSLGVNPWATSDKGAKAILRRTMEDYDASEANPQMLQSYLKRDQLDRAGVTTEFARSVGNLGTEEREKLFTDLGKDTDKFQVQDHTAHVWQEMNQAVARSKAEIETAFLKTLPAAALEETKAVQLLTSTIVDAANAIQKAYPGLTSQVNTQTTQQDLIDAVAGKGDGKDASTPTTAWGWIKKIALTNIPIPSWAGGMPDADPTAPPLTPPASLAPPGPPGSSSANAPDYSWNSIHGALAQTESRGKPNAISPVGARGLYQVMPATGAGYGYSAEQLMNPDINAKVSQQEWDKLIHKYHDPMKAAAAYNWGQGNLDDLMNGNVKKHIRGWGEDWQKHLPKETEKYITTTALAQAIRQIQQGGRGTDVKVALHNSTGQDAYIQTRLANR